jgi:hypothetical protein
MGWVGRGRLDVDNATLEAAAAFLVALAAE